MFEQPNRMISVHQFWGVNNKRPWLEVLMRPGTGSAWPDWYYDWATRRRPHTRKNPMQEGQCRPQEVVETFGTGRV